ncbi:MAG: hypothetical protein L0323_22830 [Planctomycetes bacterium]|nr:hypothetical protein [Planctomycetota bacterium]
MVATLGFPEPVAEGACECEGTISAALFGLPQVAPAGAPATSFAYPCPTGWGKKYLCGWERDPRSGRYVWNCRLVCIPPYPWGPSW